MIQKKWTFVVNLFLFSLILMIPSSWAGTSPWESFLSKKMTWPDARHLLSRAGFGGTPEEISKLTTLTYKQAIQNLLSNMQENPRTPLPRWIQKPPINIKKLRQKIKNFTPKERRAVFQQLNRERRQHQAEIKGWWMAEMVNTASPLTEKMTLFWHNHFVSSLKKSGHPLLMVNQLQLYRKYAKGNFKAFVKKISKNPAMIVYLDGLTNRKGRPNENFAREVMELFTLGEGHYTEFDIKEAARAFTGYSINRQLGTFHYRPMLHDWDQKTFMKEKGYFGGDDIIDIIFKKKQVSIYITQKLWKEFISLTSNKKEVQRLAKIFRDHNYELAPLLKAMFLSPFFWDPKNRGALIKSPVELIVGCLRIFKIPVPKDQYISLVKTCARLGQNLMDPPNVKGWEGGKRWITTNTFLMRRQISMALVRGITFQNNQKKFRQLRKLKGKKKQNMMKQMKMNNRKMRKKMRKMMVKSFMMNPNLNRKERMERIQETLLALPMVFPIQKKETLLKVIHRCLLDISFQLK